MIWFILLLLGTFAKVTTGMGQKCDKETKLAVLIDDSVTNQEVVEFQTQILKEIIKQFKNQIVTSTIVKYSDNSNCSLIVEDQTYFNRKEKNHNKIAKELKKLSDSFYSGSQSTAYNYSCAQKFLEDIRRKSGNDAFTVNFIFNNISKAIADNAFYVLVAVKSPNNQMMQRRINFQIFGELKPNYDEMNRSAVEIASVICNNFSNFPKSTMRSKTEITFASIQSAFSLTYLPSTQDRHVQSSSNVLYTTDARHVTSMLTSTYRSLNVMQSSRLSTDASSTKREISTKIFTNLPKSTMRSKKEITFVTTQSVFSSLLSTQDRHIQSSSNVQYATDVIHFTSMLTSTYRSINVMQNSQLSTDATSTKGEISTTFQQSSRTSTGNKQVTRGGIFYNSYVSLNSNLTSLFTKPRTVLSQHFTIIKPSVQVYSTRWLKSERFSSLVDFSGSFFSSESIGERPNFAASSKSQNITRNITRIITRFTTQPARHTYVVTSAPVKKNRFSSVSHSLKQLSRISTPSYRKLKSPSITSTPSYYQPTSSRQEIKQTLSRITPSLRRRGRSIHFSSQTKTSKLRSFYKKSRKTTRFSALAKTTLRPSRTVLRVTKATLRRQNTFFSTKRSRTIKKRSRTALPTNMTTATSVTISKLSRMPTYESKDVTRTFPPSFRSVMTLISSVNTTMQPSKSIISATTTTPRKASQTQTVVLLGNSTQIFSTRLQPMLTSPRIRTTSTTYARSTVVPCSRVASETQIHKQGLSTFIPPRPTSAIIRSILTMFSPKTSFVFAETTAVLFSSTTTHRSPSKVQSSRISATPTLSSQPVWSSSMTSQLPSREFTSSPYLPERTWSNIKVSPTSVGELTPIVSSTARAESSSSIVKLSSVSSAIRTISTSSIFIGRQEVEREITDFTSQNITVQQTSNTTWAKEFLKNASTILNRAEETDGIKATKETKLVVFIENTLKKVGNNLTVGIPFSITTNNLVAEVVAVNAKDFQGYEFPRKNQSKKGIEDKKGTEDSITLPNDLLQNQTKETLVIVGMKFKALKTMKPKKPLLLNEDVLALSIDPPLKAPLKSPLKYSMAIAKDTIDHQCVFWNTKLNIWDDFGCNISHVNNSRVTCECNHMTSFSVLMKINDHQISAKHRFALEIISYVGCSVSIAACVCLILVYVCLGRLIKNQRNLIHVNLSVAIAVANSLFITGDSFVEYEGVCLGISIGMLYFYLAAFFWMLVEGVHVYRMIVKVFRSKQKFAPYLFIGWVCPAIITAGVSIKYSELMTTEQFCWISTEKGVIWAFVGPAIFVIFINTIILILTLIASKKLKTATEDASELKRIAHLTLILLPVFGVSWIIGVFAVNRGNLFFQYLFTIVNVFQGLYIFIGYGLTNNEVRRAASKRLSIYQSKSNSHHQLSPMVFDNPTYSMAGKRRSMYDAS